MIFHMVGGAGQTGCAGSGNLRSFQTFQEFQKKIHKSGGEGMMSSYGTEAPTNLLLSSEGFPYIENSLG